MATEPGASAAYAAVHEAIVAGRLPLPSTVVCARCPQPAAEYHHPRGYSEAHWLDVVALCRRCHHRAHWAGRQGRRAAVALSIRPRRELAEELRRNAEASYRSLNREAELYIEEALERRRRPGGDPSAADAPPR